MRTWTAAALMFACAWGFGEEPPTTEVLMVGADTSLKGALKEFGQKFADETPGTVVQLNIAPSGMVRRMIEKEDGLDLFIGASPGEVEALAKIGKAKADTARTLAENEIVLVTTWPLRHDGRTWQSLAKLDWNRIAVASGENAMSGVAALAVFRNAGLYESVAERLYYERDSDQVIDSLRRARVDAAVVYRSDIGQLRPRDTFEVLEFGSVPQPPIVYCAVVLSASKLQKLAGQFISFLRLPEHQPIWAAHGFQPTELQDKNLLDNAPDKETPPEEPADAAPQKH